MPDLGGGFFIYEPERFGLQPVRVWQDGVTGVDETHLSPIVRTWYRSKARDYFARLIDEKSHILSWIDTPPAFRMQEMSRQWGSCCPSGSILLNPHLIKAPRPCIEYVVLHELAHLKHHDNSPEFFRLIDRQLPNWRVHKGVLDNMVEQLHLS